MTYVVAVGNILHVFNSQFEMIDAKDLSDEEVIQIAQGEVTKTEQEMENKYEILLLDYLSLSMYEKHILERALIEW